MIIYGAGGHAKVVIDCLENMQQPVELVIDDDINKASVLNYPVRQGYDHTMLPESPMIIAVGNNEVRKGIAEVIRHKAGIAIHPLASVSPHATVETGTVIFNAAIVQAHAVVGHHAIINSSAIVEHDCRVGDFAHVAPHVTLCGEVTVGEGALIGAGAVVLPGVTIGRWSTVGAGCIVKHDVPDFTVVKADTSLQQTKFSSSKKEQKIYLSPPHTGYSERQYIEEVFASNWIAPKGDALDRFENQICQFTGAAGAVALSSGTAALHLALVLLGIGEGDTVICPTFTFAATANPVLYQKAIPVFVDCEPSSWNLDLDFLEQAIADQITKGKKPKAIIAVHNYGMPIQMTPLLHMARQYEIPVIEDAAEAVGSTYQGRSTGTFGLMGVYSFNGNKIITTGGGGALVSAHSPWIAEAKFLATQACDQAPYYQHSVVGYNYRLSNVLAAIGLAQLEKLSERVTQRRAVFEYYRSHLSDMPGIRFQEEGEDCLSNRWLSCIAFEDEQAHEKVTRIRQALQNVGIEARYLWKPLHRQPVFKDYPYYGNRIAEELFNQGLCLPSGSALTPMQLDQIIRIIRSQC
jgi:sugar O-acyltransferase (sialic acid O-acetyltransferase NeuD family)